MPSSFIKTFVAKLGYCLLYKGTATYIVPLSSQIFNSIEDTEVPRLRNYVHEMTRVRKRQCVERLIRSLGRYVFDLQHYTGDNMTVVSENYL